MGECRRESEGEPGRAAGIATATGSMGRAESMVDVESDEEAGVGGAK